MKKLGDMLDKTVPVMTYMMVFVMIIIAGMIFYNIFYNLWNVLNTNAVMDLNFMSANGKFLIDGIMSLFVMITLIAAVLVYAKYGSEKGMMAILIAAIVAASRIIIVEHEEAFLIGILILLLSISLILLRKYY